MKENVYKIKINEKGQKIVYIDGRELKIAKEKAGKAILEDGSILQVVLNTNDNITIAEYDNGQVIIKSKMWHIFCYCV